MCTFQCCSVSRPHAFNSTCPSHSPSPKMQRLALVTQHHPTLQSPVCHPIPSQCNPTCLLTRFFSSARSCSGYATRTDSGRPSLMPPLLGGEAATVGATWGVSVLVPALVPAPPTTLTTAAKSHLARRWGKQGNNDTGGGGTIQRRATRARVHTTGAVMAPAAVTQRCLPTLLRVLPITRTLSRL